MRIVFHVPYPLDPHSRSASGIRPVQMLQAFHELGHEVTVVSGLAAQRRRQIRALRATNPAAGFDLAYSESSTMPTALSEPHHLPLHPMMDLTFLGWLKRAGVPVGLFYRDVYWRRDDYAPGMNPAKKGLALAAYRFDLAMYQRNLSVLFLPSSRMAREIPEIRLPIVELPPGHGVDSPAPLPTEGVRLLYVGGLGTHYRMDELLRAVHQAQAAGADVQLRLVTREAEWAQTPESTRSLVDQSGAGPVQVVHAGPEELGAHYAWANACSLAVAPNSYRDFAMPVKLFEYLGQGRGVLATEGTLAAEVVATSGAGWAVPYRAAELAATLVELASQPENLVRASACAAEVAGEHTWGARAQRVIDTLTSLSANSASARPVSG